MYRNAKVLAFSCYPSAALSCTHIPAHVYTHARACMQSQNQSEECKCGRMSITKEPNLLDLFASVTVRLTQQPKTRILPCVLKPAGTPRPKHPSNVGGIVSDLSTGQQHRPQNESGRCSRTTFGPLIFIARRESKNHNQS